MTTTSVLLVTSHRTEKNDTLPLEDAVVLLEEAEEERAEADSRLKDILTNLGIGL